jgi:hypothetical protein
MVRILVAALMLLTSEPSWAGWQNTSWGMTFSELIASGKGNITPYTDDKDTLGPGEKVQARQPYVEANIPYTAYFYFKEGKLRAVSLIPDRPGTLQRIHTLLKETYGGPIQEWRSKSLICAVITTVWIDKKFSNSIGLFYLRCPNHDPISSITYRASTSS